MEATCIFIYGPTMEAPLCIWAHYGGPIVFFINKNMIKIEK